jgi:hypothetical protein
MKFQFFKSLVLGSMLLASSGFADGFGFNIGPFNMQFGISGGDYAVYSRSALDSPICFAISNRKQLELIVEGTENISTKERKVVIKKLVVDPYAFGIARDGAPVLRGNVVSEKLISEETVKYGEDTFDQPSVSSDKKEKGYFSGLFSSDKTKNIDIRKVSNIRVIEDSHFDAPKNYKGLKDDNIQVICQLPIE